MEFPHIGEFRELIRETKDVLDSKSYRCARAYAKKLAEEIELRDIAELQRLGYVQRRLREDGKKDFGGNYDSHIISMILQGIYGIHMGVRPDDCMSQLTMPFFRRFAEKQGFFEIHDGMVFQTEKGRETAEQFAKEEPEVAKKVDRMTEFAEDTGEGDIKKGMNWLYENLTFNWVGSIEHPALRPYMDALKEAYLS